MKRKRINKKLVLNKKTVAHLNNQVMNGIHGGLVTDDTCDSCNPETQCLGCETLICPDERETDWDCMTFHHTDFPTCRG